MTILQAWRSGQIKLVYSSVIIRPLHLNTHSSSKFILPQIYYSTPFRYFSWEGFYISISSSTPVLTIQNALLDVHNFSGLPWWAVISLSTLMIRSFCVFPLSVHQNQVIGRLANINTELQKMAPELNKEVNIARKMYGWDDHTARNMYMRNMKQFQRKFTVRDNCHPFKIVLLALFQIPVWICFSVALRNLTMNPFLIKCDSQELQHQLKTEGTLWFKDLTVPDSLFLPILLALVNLVLIEIHALRQIGKGSTIQKAILYFMRFSSLAIAFVATINPSSVTFYWLCSSTFGLTQNVLLMIPRFRRFLRIPHTGKESSTPFKDIVSNFKRRFVS